MREKSQKPVLIVCVASSASPPTVQKCVYTIGRSVATVVDRHRSLAPIPLITGFDRGQRHHAVASHGPCHRRTLARGTIDSRSEDSGRYKEWACEEATLACLIVRLAGTSMCELRSDDRVSRSCFNGRESLEKRPPSSARHKYPSRNIRSCLAWSW